MIITISSGSQYRRVTKFLHFVFFEETAAERDGQPPPPPPPAAGEQKQN